MACILRPVVAAVKYLLYEDEFTELRSAIISGDIRDAATILNSSEIDLNRKDHHDQTLLSCTVGGIRHWTDNGKLKRRVIVSLLLQKGADPSIGCGKRKINFLYMILKDDPDIDIVILKMILAHKKDIVYKDPLNEFYFYDQKTRGNEREALFLLIRYGLPQSAAKNKCKETVSICFKLIPYLVARRRVPDDFVRTLAMFLLGDL